MAQALIIPDLKDKAVLITGASTGIGAALARAFARQGAKVGLHYNSGIENARAVADEIEAAGGSATLLQGDLSKPEDVERVVEEAVAALGGLDGLINNAGAMIGRVDYADATNEYYDQVMDLNARSVIIASRVAFAHMKAKGGFIINTSSIAGRTGGLGGAGIYGSAKAFVSNATRGMAKEFIPYGIRVNAVSPGVITTPFQERYSTPEGLEAIRQGIPMGRLGTAEDCVGAYLFLASEMLSGYVIGQTLEVNGGQLMP
ncbi:SDR family NAD(P)-dependent oxidoreductase [Pelagibacterium halotolerans]|uniref:SDR family NAD(P)-dependent oxidoreductase n=1 Tax=Pelagibacterium halotolerans TaxID=531813 RepID=UPI00384EEE67